MYYTVVTKQSEKQDISKSMPWMFFSFLMDVEFGLDDEG